MVKRMPWYAPTLLIAAFVSRMAALHAVPLAADEATYAWSAWLAAHGEGWQQSSSPLLTTGNALLFALFGAGDGIARLLPALAGASLVAVPWLWRHTLGPLERNAASLFLILSPILIAASRRLEGTAIAALAIAMLATALWEGGQAMPTSLLALAWGLGLTAGPRFWDGLIALAIAYWLTEPRLPLDRSYHLRGMLYGVGVAWLLSTGCGWNLSGSAGPMSGLAAWMAEERMAIPHPLLDVGTLLLAEPLTLLLASFAFWRRGKAQEHFLLLWAGGTLLLLLLHGTEPRSLALLLPPLAILAGEGIAELRESRPLPWPGPFVQELSYALLFIFALLLLMRYTTYNATGKEVWLSLIVVMLGGLLYAGFALTVAEPFATRAFVRGIAAVLFLIQMGIATSTAWVRSANPAEPLSWPTASPDLPTLASMVKEYSRLYTVTPEALTVEVEGEVPQALWALRDFPALRAVSAPTDPPPSILVTPASSTSSIEGGHGMAVTISTRTSLRFPDGRAFLNWLFYRRPPQPIEKESVVLWWSAPPE